MIAALYVARGGVYWDLPDVDPWDEERDARKYAGPWPVVAHPPCARWCQLASVNEVRYGQKIGDDDGCFAAALFAVRLWGGVLEHPAYSLAWDEFALPRPARGGWTQGLYDTGWTCEVAQSAYGHRARKLTWLYYCGPQPLDMLWKYPAATAQVSWGKVAGGTYWKQPLSKQEASETPAAFRDALLSLARNAQTQNPPHARSAETGRAGDRRTRDGEI